MKRLLLLSHIPIYRDGSGAYVTERLWARDVNANASVASINLLCPVRNLSGDLSDAAPIADNITPYALDGIAKSKLTELVLANEVVQVPGNFPWRESRYARMLLKLASRHGKVGVVVVSSNRARTALLNSIGRSFPRRVKAFMSYLSIRLSQRLLARLATGVYVVGDGLRALVEKDAKALMVGTASWIRHSDVRPTLSEFSSSVDCVIASRLELMKGVHVGLAAFSGVMNSFPKVALSVIGVGPEQDRLKEQAKGLGIAEATTFVGQLSYPREFLDRLSRANFVVLTNLNQEQPRLIFDAVSQGAIPVCPSSPVYLSLGLHPDAFYKQGDSSDLTRVLCDLMQKTPEELGSIRERNLSVLSENTLDSMHRKRLDWFEELCHRLEKNSYA